MEEPLFAEVKDEVKEEEEPYDDFLQKNQAQVFTGGLQDEELEEKPDRDELDKIYMKPPGCVPQSTGSENLQKPSQRIFSPIRRVFKRPLPNETEGAAKIGNLPTGDILPSEMGEGNEEPTVKVKKCQVEARKKPPFEEQPRVEPSVEALPFAFNCPQCRMGFQEVSVLQSHVKEIHPGVQPLRCHLCPEKYDDAEALWIHLVLEHKVPPPLDPAGFWCNECGGHFPQGEKYAYHRQFYRGQPHFYCKICDYPVYTSEREEHLAKKHHLVAQRRSEQREMNQLINPYIGIEDVGCQGTAKFGNLPDGEGLPSGMNRPLWEKAAGSQNAEDILREKHDEEEPIGTVEKTGEANEKPPNFENQSGKPLLLFLCPQCRMGFQDVSVLQSHVKEMHSGVQPLRCHLCPEKYDDPEALWVHLVLAHKVPPPPDPAGFWCNECGGHFRQGEKYAYHRQFYRGQPHFYCKICDYPVYTSEREEHLAKKQHLVAQRRSDQRELNQLLDWRMKKEDVLCRKRSAPSVYSCLECEKRCVTWTEYQEHREGLKKKPHAFCEPCGMVLDQDQWEKHQKTVGHTGVRLLLHCCDLVFRPDEWEEHQLMKCHKESKWIDKVPLAWKCPEEECEVAFAREIDLWKHMDLHPGVPPFPCRHCPQQLWNRAVRYSHEDMEHSSL